MELNWDAPLLNGRQSFFTETRYNQFSIAPTFAEVLEDSLPPEVKERLRREAAETSEKIPTQAEVQNVQATAVQQPSAASKPPATSATKKPAVTSANIKPPVLNVLGKPPSSYPVPRIPFPRLSTLMHGEQKTYMELFRKYQFYNPARPPGPIEMREIQQFRDLQMKVGPEQEEFMRYLEFVATQSPQDYSFMQPQAKKYMQEVLTANNRSIPMMGYPQFYKVYQTVGISTVGFKTDPVMRHVKTLLEMGSVPGLKLPKANETAMVLPSYEEIVDHKPVNIPAKVDKNTSQKVVSEDENAQKLAAKYGAHIVLSASALCTLLDNHAPHYQEQWELPVTVKESTSTGDSTCTTKIVVIDKPLPKKNITAREKNTLFHSIALELFLTDKGASTVLEKLRSDRYTATDIHNLDAPSDEMEPSSSIEKDMQWDDTKEKMGRTCQERKEEDLLGNNQDLADLETFGEGSRRRITKKTSVKMQTVQTTKISQEKEESQHVETHTVDTIKSRDIDDQCKEIENTSSQMEVTDNEGKPLVEAEDHVEKLENTKNRVTTSAQVALDSDVNSQKNEVQVEEEGRSDIRRTEETKKPTARAYSSQDSDSDLGLMIVTDSDSQGEGSPVKTRGNQKKVSETIDSSGSKEDKLQLKETDQESTEKKDDRLTEGENDSKVIESAMTGMTLRNRRSPGQAKSSQMSPPLVKRQRTDSEEPSTDKAKMEDKSTTDMQKKVTDDSSDSTVQAKVPQMTKDSNAENKMDTSDGRTVAADPAVQSPEDGGAATTRKGAAAKSESEGKGGVLDTLGQIMQLQENLQKFQAEEKQGQVKPSVPRGVVLPRQPSSCPQPALSGVKQAPHSREQLEYCLPADLKLCQENLQDYTRPDKHNVVYSLMSFGKLLLLVRSDLQAVSRTPGGHFKWFAHVQSKLEYQPDFGVEQLTPGEMCREWISTYIMPPDSRLIRVRINAFTSEVMLVEQLKHNQILDHRVHFSPGTAMKMLLSVLEKVQSLPPGDFLLTHNPGDVHICIYQGMDSSASKKGAYDLHTAHQQAAATPTPETRPPWVPLDPSIILPQHWQNGRVPATFEPRPPNPPPVKKWQPQPGKTKGKKKKKSKKT